MPQPINYSDSTPAAPAGEVNNKWQADTPGADNVVRNVSVYTPIATATAPGAVPTPPNDGTKFLAGDATWKTVTTTHSLATDTDVTLTSPADGDLLTYDAGSSKWENKPASGGGGGGASATLFDHYADVGSVSTTETNLFSDTLVANQFASNGSEVLAVYGGTFVNSSSTKQLRAYLGGTLVFDSGALTVGATDGWELRLAMVRESSTNVRVIASFVSPLGETAQYTKVTGLTLSATNVLKITGTSAGAGVANGDVTASVGVVYTLRGTSGGGGTAFPLHLVQFYAFQSGTSNSTTYTVTFPQAAAGSGKTMFIFLAADGSGAFTAPSGWTVDLNKTATYSRFVLMHKTSAGDTSAVLTSASPHSFAGYFFEVDGSHTLDQSSTGSISNQQYMTFPAITPTLGATVYAVIAYMGNTGYYDQGPKPSFPFPTWVTDYVQASGSVAGRGLIILTNTTASDGTAITPPYMTFPGFTFYIGAGLAYATFSIV